MVVIHIFTEPHQTTKEEPLGSLSIIFLLTTCTLCGVFLLWRRASSFRTVVAHQLQTWNQGDGHIRLSFDDGPSSREFLDDDYDDDNEGLGDSDQLVATAERLRKAVPPVGQAVELAPSSVLVEAGADEPPLPPPKA